MRLHDQRADIYSVSYIYVIAQLPAIAAALNTWLEKQKVYEGCALLMATGPDGNRTLAFTLPTPFNDTGSSVFDVERMVQ
jgi:hypothetical protein